MNADGTGLRLLVDLPDVPGIGVASPQWSPSGAFIAFSRASNRVLPDQMWISNVAGTRQWRVATRWAIDPQDWKR
ncbi:MAG: hypothetical protein V9G19_25515 [Tetrasphaera sp.]